MQRKLSLAILALLSGSLFAKDISKQVILDRARASIAASTCDSKVDLHKCLKPDDQILCGEYVSDAFTRCLTKLDASFKASYRSAKAAKDEMLALLGCTVGHFGIIAKEDGKWATGPECEIKFPASLRIAK